MSKKTRLSRRAFLQRAAASSAVVIGSGGALGTLLAACGSPAAAPTPLPAKPAAVPAAPAAVPTAPAVVKAATEPFRLGVATPMSGAYELVGKDVRTAIDVYLREINKTVLGRPVELMLEDTETKADVALRKVEKLATKDGCKYITGLVSSAESMAIADKMPEFGAVYIATISRTTKLTGEACNKNLFRVVTNDSQDTASAAAFLDANPDLKRAKWALFGADYEWGRDIISQFKKNAGITPVLETFAALGTTDFSTVINKLREAKPDVVYVANGGTDMINFVKQAAGFGMMSTMKFLWATTIPDSVLPALGDAVLGVMSTSDYSWTIDNPANKKFVESYKQVSNGVPPSAYAGDTYTGMVLLFTAIEKAGSTDMAKVIPVMEELSFSNPVPTKVRKGDHSVFRESYVMVIEKNAGAPSGLAHKVIYAGPAEKILPPLEQTGCKMKA